MCILELIKYGISQSPFKALTPSFHQGPSSWHLIPLPPPSEQLSLEQALPEGLLNQSLRFCRPEICISNQPPSKPVLRSGDHTLRTPALEDLIRPKTPLGFYSWGLALHFQLPRLRPVNWSNSTCLRLHPLSQPLLPAHPPSTSKIILSRFLPRQCPDHPLVA